MLGLIIRHYRLILLLLLVFFVVQAVKHGLLAAIVLVFELLASVIVIGLAAIITWPLIATLGSCLMVLLSPFILLMTISLIKYVFHLFG